MKIIIAAATAFALAGPPTLARSAVQSTDPVEAAAYLLNTVCLQILDGQAITSERVARLVAEARLVERNGRWLARTGPNSGLILTWNPQNETCQIAAAGTGPVGEAFLAWAERAGWRSMQREEPALEGGIVDLMCGRPEGWRHDVCMTVLQKVPTEPNGTFMTVTVLRAP